MRVLFVGINPGIRSSLTGHHFAGFSNRFWKLLYESRLVPEPIGYWDDVRLPDWGYGVTNIVPRPTPGIDTIRREEYVRGRARLRRKVLRYRPAVVAGGLGVDNSNSSRKPPPDHPHTPTPPPPRHSTKTKHKQHQHG